MNKSKRTDLNNSQNLRTAESVFKKCPHCGCKDLLKFEVDLFCSACDWDSILYDVNSGNFEKRIAGMNRKKSNSVLHLHGNTVVHLPIEPTQTNSSTDKKGA